MSDLTVSDLSGDQRAAYDAIVKWARNPPLTRRTLRLGGYAGSGKSSLLGLLAKEDLGPMAFAAFTGKAASVLRKKLAESGVATRGRLRRDRRGQLWEGQDEGAKYVGTIHSLSYLPVEDIETGRVTGFGKQEGLDAQYRLLCLDEASMISEDMLEHLESYGVPILLVGDHGQLPPVRGESAIARPDIRLEKIHRQALGNPILRLSEHIRKTGQIDQKLVEGDPRVQFLPSFRKGIDLYEGLGREELAKRAFIVYTNRNRVRVNDAIRDRLGRSALTRGEQVVCLKNIQRAPVYNGMRGFLSDVMGGEVPWQAACEVDFPDDEVQVRLFLSTTQFGREKTFEEFPQAEEAIAAAGHVVGKKIETWGAIGSLFDYGYCVTGHKMQGSQVEEAIVLAERPQSTSDDGWRRWLYTCVTRASDRLKVIL